MQIIKELVNPLNKVFLGEAFLESGDSGLNEGVPF
jgi:hypothetical protein